MPAEPNYGQGNYVKRDYNIVIKDKIESLNSITFTDDVHITAFPFKAIGMGSKQVIRIIFMGGKYGDPKTSFNAPTYDITLDTNEIIKKDYSVAARKEDIDKIVEKLGVIPVSIRKTNQGPRTAQNVLAMLSLSRKRGGRRKTYRATKKIRRNRRRN